MEKITQEMVLTRIKKVVRELSDMFGKDEPVRIMPINDRAKAVVMLMEALYPHIKQSGSKEEAEAILGFTVNGFFADEDEGALKAADLFPISIDHHVEFVLPWESIPNAADPRIAKIKPIIYGLLEHVADNRDREGLLETPNRVAKAWMKWTEGYHMDAGSLLKVFEDGADGCDEMVVVKDIPIYSKCEHHLADIFGTATIAYIPNGKIVGLSKLSRLAEMFSRRLQVQERLTNQIADAIAEHLDAKGVGVVIRARHMCMESRGICQQGHHTITSALRGAMKDNHETRAEFMTLATTEVKV